MKKNSMVQIMAFLALFGIIIGIVGTGILIIFSGNNTGNNNVTNSKSMTQEDLQNIINKSKDNNNLTKTQISLTGSKLSLTGSKDLQKIVNENINTLTGKINK